MTGRLSQLRRRRDTVPPDPSRAASAEQPTTVMPIAAGPLFADAPPAPAPAGPALPADVAPGTQASPSFRDRGRFRRRLRYLRRVRELGFRDLGGLVFDLHRFGRTGDEIVRAKLVALDAVDRELRALERVLKDERAFTDLREPGVAACARCGSLHGSDARFCPSCGVALGGPTPLGVALAAAHDAPAAPDPSGVAPP
ncbi:MAG: zinc ribbon protein, partial [Solirubrobacterales bacterium]|nr:zinc ribbon protein [Solirubrobacterales bacterium]